MRLLGAIVGLALASTASAEPIDFGNEPHKGANCQARPAADAQPQPSSGIGTDPESMKKRGPNPLWEVIERGLRSDRDSTARLPQRVGAARRSIGERVVDTDGNGLAEALELRLGLPTRAGRPALAAVELLGFENQSLRFITYATLRGSDVWNYSLPVIYVPVCSTCAGNDSLAVEVDGERLRRWGIDGPYVVRVQVWEGRMWESGAKFIGEHEWSTGHHVAARFGWLPARILKTDLLEVREDIAEVAIQVLVEQPMTLELRGDIHEGGESHSTAHAGVPATPGVHEVRMRFQRRQAEGGAVAAPSAEVWLTSPERKWPETALRENLWMRDRRTIALPADGGAPD